MRPSQTKGGSGYIFGCAAIMLLALLSVAGLFYGVVELLSLAERHGIQSGDVIVAAVALVAVYSLYQVRRNRG